MEIFRPTVLVHLFYSRLNMPGHPSIKYAFARIVCFKNVANHLFSLIPQPAAAKFRSAGAGYPLKNAPVHFVSGFFFDN